MDHTPAGPARVVGPAARAVAPPVAPLTPLNRSEVSGPRVADVVAVELHGPVVATPAGRAETVALYRTWLAGDHPTVRGFGAAALAPCHREVLLDLAAGDGVARQLAAGRAVDQVAVGNVVRTRR